MALSFLFTTCKKDKEDLIDVELYVTNNLPSANQCYIYVSFKFLADETINFYSPKDLGPGGTFHMETNELGKPCSPWGGSKPLKAGTYKWVAGSSYGGCDATGTCVITDGQTTSITIQ